MCYDDYDDYILNKLNYCLEEEKRLVCKIQFLEDKMFRTRDYNKQNKLREDIVKLRSQLQKVRWEMDKSSVE